MVDIPRAVELREVPWATYKLKCIYIKAIYVVPKATKRKRKKMFCIEVKTMKCLL
jgi:hypothetical protein